MVMDPTDGMHSSLNPCVTLDITSYDGQGVQRVR